jgi:hypothetical protein
MSLCEGNKNEYRACVVVGGGVERVQRDARMRVCEVGAKRTMQLRFPPTASCVRNQKRPLVGACE